MFYKFISEKQIKKVKFPFKTEDKLIFSSDSEELTQYGIYPLVVNTTPIEEGFCAIAKYRIDDNVIVKDWELVPLPPSEATDEDYLSALAEMGVEAND